MLLYALLLTVTAANALAQDVSIPDPGLNAAVRAALEKPNGPLTEQDMLNLTTLDASRRSVKSISGLETARNLISLDLQINQLTNVSLPSVLTNLKVLNLSANPLTIVSLPPPLTNLTSLTVDGGGLTSLPLPTGLTGLTNLDLENNQLTDFVLSSSLTGLVDLNLGFNQLTHFSLPGGLTNLSTFYFAGNPLTNVTLPSGLVGLRELNLSQNLLTTISLPMGMTNLEELDLGFNQLTNVALPGDLANLEELDLNFNRLTTFSLPTNLTSLEFLHLRANLFTNFNLTTALPSLSYLDVSESPLAQFTLSVPLPRLTTLRLAKNALRSITLPLGLTNLTALNLSSNLLTNVVLPADLGRLETLLLGANQLTTITLPAGLTNLEGLFLPGNSLTNVTLPPDMARLAELGLAANPLATVVLPETLAHTTLEAVVVALQSQGISVVTYPLTIQLVRPRSLPGALQFGVTGPPGVYSILESGDLTAWNVLRSVTNPLGSISFIDVTAQFWAEKFYRAVLQAPPTDMVFIPPSTFTMGSPSSDFDRSANESPQTTVTLTRGFWIAKHEVTQREYVAVMNTNPSAFTNSLDIAVSSVSWQDATNYCTRLTQRELAAGRIPPGGRYRLPTEAEWECAARAGTSTRFSYGDDLNYVNAANHAWVLENANLMAHPVGQKLPNPWGLYDMEGNVWEWCQDWYGALPGGSQVDPTGPPLSNPIGYKVMRGGAFDYPASSSRSASRLFFGESPLLTDWDLGFRVVFALAP